MKTRSSQMMGVAWPLPGIFTFHLTLLVSLHVVGGLANGATPFWSGPRHCGQFSLGRGGGDSRCGKGKRAGQPRRVGERRQVSFQCAVMSAIVFKQVGSIEAGMRMVFMAASTSFRPWPVMSSTICSLRPSSSDPCSFFNAATVAAAAGSANTPAFSASVLCPRRISWSDDGDGESPAFEHRLACQVRVRGDGDGDRVGDGVGPRGVLVLAAADVMMDGGRALGLHTDQPRQLGDQPGGLSDHETP